MMDSLIRSARMVYSHLTATMQNSDPSHYYYKVLGMLLLLLRTVKYSERALQREGPKWEMWSGEISDYYVEIWAASRTGVADRFLQGRSAISSTAVRITT